MEKYCIIPNSNQALAELAESLPLNIDCKNSLKKAKIIKIVVTTQPAAWHMTLQIQDEVKNEDLQIIRNYLCKKCDLEDVTITKVDKNLSLVLKENWTNIIQQIFPDSPSLRLLLSQSEWILDGTTLSLKLIGQLSCELLEKQNFDQKLAKYTQMHFDTTLDIRYIIEEAPQSCEDEQDLMTPEYITALNEAESVNQIERPKEPVIFGKTIKATPQPMNLVQEEAKNIVCEGKILCFEGRELRSGRFLLTYDIVDATDGISGKTFFETKEQFDKVIKNMHEGMNVRVKGTVKTDKFSNDLIMFTDSMCVIEQIQRIDSAAAKRIELHLHTRMSTLDSVVSTKEIIKTAAKWGHSALAITDHGVVQAFPEAYEVAEKAGIKVIFGMEGYLFDTDINQSYHILILAQNPTGLRNLYRLVSISHLKYMHRKPRIPRKVLLEHREGLLLGTACEAGELYQALLRGEDSDTLQTIASMYDFLEIQPIGNNHFLLREGKVNSEVQLQEMNRQICELGEKIEKPVIATCDVHFINPEDEIYRRILLSGQGYQDAELQPPLYFRTTDEMLTEFQYLGTNKAFEVVVSNTHKINDIIGSFKPIPDELYSPQIPGAEEMIKNMAYERATQLYGNSLPTIVEERLQYELNSIINNGFAVLYLIAHKLVKKSLDDGYLVGSRGSVGSSFVATMTGITEVNPLPPHWVCSKCKHTEFVNNGSFGSGFDLPDKYCPSCDSKMKKDGHDIPFAVFMGFHGDKVPDIDLNFSGEYQPTAHKYTEELFGRDNVFRAGTIATIAEKTAYGFVKNYFNDQNLFPRKARIDSLISGCTGVKRTTGQHPGGIMVVPRDLDIHFFTPIQYPADDKQSATITTHFDYHSISSRLVKLDILGHDDPTVIKMLEDLTGLNAKTIPMDDTDTMSLFHSTDILGITPDQLGSNVGTLGIPEFGTKFVRQMLEDTQPKNFSELVRISGFSHGTDVWINNAQDLIKSGTAKLSEAISARDDIMTYLIHKGLEPGNAFKIMEGVRKGKGVKPEDSVVMQQHNVPNWYIESCQKIKYMFPKAHAAAYVMMAFRIAYYKVHYPLAFYAAYFSVRATDFDADLIAQGQHAIKRKLSELEQKNGVLTAKEKGLLTVLELALEMNLRGFKIVKVDLDTSCATQFLISGDSLIPPFASLEGIGDNAAKNIVEARKQKPFSSIEDLKVRAKVSKSIVEILCKHGCLNNLPATDQTQLFA